MSTRSTASAWVVVVAIAWLGRIAAAEPLPADAQAMFDEGNAAMARRDSALAAARYRAAWDRAADARIVLNLGIALAELGRVAEAAEAFAIYLADPASDPAKRAVVEGRLARWRPALGAITLDVAAPGLVIEIDGVRPLRSAPGTRVPVAPGSHLVAARAPGYRLAEQRVTVAAEALVTARLVLAPQTIALAPAPRPARPWTWIALGAGAAAAVTGSYFGVVAISGWRTVHDHCPDGACTSAAEVARAADARRAGTRANIAFGVAGAAVITALVLWRVEPGRRAQWSIAPRASGGMLWVTGAL